MNEQMVFKINDLMCGYADDLPVLYLKELSIPSGQLVFVIGRSGIGKSTFIETLGLMNQTIINPNDCSISFFPIVAKDAIELKNSWALDNSRLSQFRKKHFSFIFQNTNLMPNFSAGENMMVSLLIEGKKSSEAKEEVLSVMERLSLDSSIFDKKITALSGGQRQRLAFVRAITANFAVLFGDEPTGNLDKNTSAELMTIMKEHIHEKNKTGIIVSHDLHLALKFADMIIPITEDENHEQSTLGGVKLPNIIIRKKNNWYTKISNDIISKPMEYLNQFLEVNK